MKKERWRWILVAGMAVLAVALVWFYFPMHLKVSGDPEVTVRYRDEEFVLTREQRDRVVSLAEQMTGRQRVFMSRYLYLEKQNEGVYHVQIDQGDSRRIIAISISMGWPREAVIDTGVQGRKYVVFDAEPLLKEIEAIVKEKKAAKAEDLPEEGPFWELLEELQSATTEQKEMTVYDKAKNDITSEYLSGWAAERSKEPEDFARYLADQAKELIAVLPEEPEADFNGTSRQDYTVLHYQKVVSTDKTTEAGFVFRVRVSVRREADGTVFHTEFGDLQVASAYRGWTVQGADARLDVLEGRRVKGIVSYRLVPELYYEPESGLPDQYVTFWIRGN